MRGAPASVTTHITGIQSANSHPETSAQRPETRNPSTALPCPTDRSTAKVAGLKALSHRDQNVDLRAHELLIQTIHATEASAQARIWRNGWLREIVGAGKSP
jgi:hypothetical protein